MTSPTPAERLLFTDLTRIFMSMQETPHGEVEAQIEARFREFVRSQAQPGVGGLQITFTWTLPDGADDWAIYQTDYRTVPAEPRAAPRLAVAGGGSAAILAFPPQPASRATARGYQPAKVLAFPSR